MNMTDVLLQTLNQATWTLSTSVSASKSSGQESGTSSFQELLEDRRTQLNQTPDRSQGTTQQPEREDTVSAQGDDQQEPVPDGEQTVLAAALLGQVVPVQIQEMPAQEPAAAVEGIQQSGILQAAGQDVLPETTPLVQQVVMQQPEDKTVQTDVQQPVQQVSDGTSQQTQTVAAVPQKQESAETGAEAQDFTAAQQQEGKPDTDTTQVSGAWETPVFQEAEHMPVKVGETVEIDTTGPAAEVDAKLNQVLAQAAEDGSQHVEITLSPAHLGTVTAEFTRSPEGVLHLVLRAENEHAARLLSEHATTLGLMLQDSTRGEVRVEVPQPNQSQQQPWQQEQNGGQQQQQQQQQQRQVPRQEAETFLHQLRLGLLQSVPEAV